MGPADHQYLLDQRRNPVDAVEDDAAVLLRTRVIGEHAGHQLGRAFDAGQRILDLVREAGGRQSQAQIAGDRSLGGAFFMGQVVQENNHSARTPFGVQ